MKQKIFTSLLFVLAAGLCGITASARAQVVALEHVRLIDGAGSPPVEDATIVLADRKIRALGPSGEVEVPDGAERLDLSGKTVMPGVINLHGHVGMVKGLTQSADNYTRENVTSQLETLANYGVTTVVSLGTDLDLMLDIRGEQRRGRIYGARVFTALQGFTRRGGYPTHAPGVKGVAQEVATAAQARAWVKQLHEKGADVVKMWVDDGFDKFPKLTPKLYGAIIGEAHKHGLKAFAHIWELSDAKGLVEAGVDVIAHSVRDEEVDEEFIAQLKENGVTYVPTLTREQSLFAYADPPEWLGDPFFTKGVEPEVIEAVRTELGPSQKEDPKTEVYREGFNVAMRNLKTLSEAGVRIGFGTDSGPPARFPGFFEHWEMELMTQAGLTPMEVIQSFSQTAAETLEVEDRLGTLEKGKAADLVVLDKNPLDGIRNTRTIHSVYVAGKRFP